MKIYPLNRIKNNYYFFKKKDKINNKYLSNGINLNNIYFTGNFDVKMFLQELKYENAEKKYYFPQNTENGIKYSDKILSNKEALEKLRILDNLTFAQKKKFIEEFSLMTGFPEFKKVVQNIENEIFNSIHTLAKKEDFDVKFIGYDSNCSVGRKLSIPGSDCDGLFMIIDTKEHKEPWYSGKIRWDFKDYVNQRILSTPANHLPEVLSLEFIEKGLDVAQNAFKKCQFSKGDLRNFENLLNDNSNDFVKSGKFNIQLAKKIPLSDREIYYKTAMLVEIIRDGVVCENNFDKNLNNKILNSPLYKYSNLMKQKGLKTSMKTKYIQRQTLESNFNQADIEDKFQLIKDILYFSFGKIQDNENKKYFLNAINNGNDEMGNIEKMYATILKIPFDDK